MLEEGESGAKGHLGLKACAEGAWPRFHGNRLGHKEDRKSKAGMEWRWEGDRRFCP